MRWSRNLGPVARLECAVVHPLVQPRGQWMRDVLSDEEVARRVVAGESELFELLVRRHNQRLYRTVRAIVQDDDEAEEALQLAYVAAWRRLETFDGRARFTTWITQVATRTAADVARARQRQLELAQSAARAVEAEPPREPAADREATSRELRRWLERSIDALPEPYRVVFVLRVLEGLTTAEVACDLDLTEVAVKVRLHRAREKLQADLLRSAESLGAVDATWAIAGERCDRITAGVFARMRGGVSAQLDA
jgi:RNA polymerase sigma-70 factor (ECF subfamily)